MAWPRRTRFDVVVTYKLDRLTRALSDFAKITEIFEAAASRLSQ
jgi:DNA invertase Pin-like site-specific DNA recombinase